MSKIDSQQVIYEYLRTIKKQVKKTKTKKVELPRELKIEFVLPKKPLIIYELQDAFCLKEEYDRDNRIYTKREMEKFRVMRSEVTIDEFGFHSKNPPSFLYDSELVLKINKKHNNSVYNSDLHFHERSEDNVFPLNRIQKFKLIDLEAVANTINPISKEGLDIILNSKEKKSEFDKPEIDPSNTNKNPPLKHFNITTLISPRQKQSFQNSTTISTIEERMATTSLVDERKKDLVILLEKNNFVVETTKPNRLNYFYKNNSKAPKASSFVSTASNQISLTEFSNCKSPLFKSSNNEKTIFSQRNQTITSKDKADSFITKEFQSPTSLFKKSVVYDLNNNPKPPNYKSSSRYSNKNLS